MPSTLKAKDYVENAFKISQGTYDPDLFIKTKRLDEIPEIFSDYSWLNFIAAVLDENNFLYGEATTKKISRHNKLKGLREKTFNEMFERYGLLEEKSSSL